MNQVPKHGVFADRMYSGLDWMWVEMLTVMVDWIGLDWVSNLVDWVGLDFEKWTHGHLWHTVLFRL